MQVNEIFQVALQYHREGKLAEALSTYAEILSLQPHHFDTNKNLGQLLQGQRRLDEAEHYYSRALGMEPENVGLLIQLGNVLKGRGRLDQAMMYFDRAIELERGNRQAWDAKLTTLYYLERWNGTSVLREHLVFGQQFAASAGKGRIFSDDYFENREAEMVRSADPTRLRVGYVSPDFRGHCQAFFMLPLLTHHDTKRVEVICYSDVVRADALTDRLKEKAAIWRDISGKSDAEALELIRADRVDVLVDLALHMPGNRLGVFAERAAPVQVTWLGYPGTTGVSAMDFRLTDPYLDPADETSEAYCEESVMLPETFWCYHPLTDRPQPGDLPMFQNDHATFGCLNNFCKINETTLQLWARVLMATGNSKLLMMAPVGSARKWVSAVMQQGDVASERIEFVDYQPRPEYLRTYQRIDIGLDTFPYNGHTTSLDALWMGVPIVTMAGKQAVGRAGVSQCGNLEMGELVAHSPKEFVKIAGDLAADPTKLKRRRQMLRARMLRSPLMDAPRFARNLENAYLQMWEQRRHLGRNLPGRDDTEGGAGTERGD